MRLATTGRRRATARATSVRQPDLKQLAAKVTGRQPVVLVADRCRAIIAARDASPPTPLQDLERAQAAAQRAVALEPSSAEAHLRLAQVKALYDNDWKGARAEIEVAHRADPNVTMPMELAFVAGCNIGPCFDQFIRDLSGEIDRDPLNASAYRTRGYIRYAAGELEGAESDLRRALELSPSLVTGRYWLTLVLIARHELADVLSVASAEAGEYRRAGLPLAYQALGRQAEADAALRDLVTQDARNGCLEIARAYAFRGDNAAALDWLERDYQLHLAGRMYFPVDPNIVRLAHEPRYVSLMQQLDVAD
jgi:tetratricopeptide (TPR) repeat protein